MLSNITKKLNLLARVIVPLFVAASFFGCSSALESGLLPGGAVIDGLSASFQQAAPPALANTDWLMDKGSGADPRYIVINFIDNDDGKLLDNNGDITNFTYAYTYDPQTGKGTITVSGVTWTFTVTDGVMSIVIPNEGTFPATLIEVRLTTITGFVGNGPTPRYDYSSIDFETDGVTVQMTFADGTYPFYELVYYDGVSAGIIDTLGLFYLDYSNNGTASVIFPDFYGYHMGQNVVYTTSAEILPSLEGSIWGTSTGSDTVRFSGGRAYFTGGYIFDTAYFYDGYQAGGAYGAGGSDTLGSFRILDTTSPLTMRFYVYQGTRPFDFTLQVPPPSVKLPGAVAAE